jgi:hypothetical protein
MFREYQRSTWPFLVVLIVLFVLSAVAPRVWQQVARDRSAEQLLAETVAEPRRSTAAPGCVATTAPGCVATTAPGCVDHNGADMHGADVPSAAKRDAATASKSLGPELASPLANPSPSEPEGWLSLEPAGKFGRRPVTTSELRLPTELPPSDEPSDEAAETTLSAKYPTLLRLPSIDKKCDKERDKECDPSGIHRQPPPTGPALLAKSPLPRDTLGATAGLPSSADGNLASPPFTAGQASSGTQRWYEPKQLIAQLKTLTDERATRRWAGKVLDQLHKLGPAVVRNSPQTRAIHARLDALCKEADALAVRLKGNPPSAKLRSAAGGLRRRLDVWVPLFALDMNAAPADDLPKAEPEQLALALTQIDAMTAHGEESRAWRTFLLLDALEKLPEQSGADEAARQRELARRVLKRVAMSRLTDSQREFLTTQPFRTLGRQLRCLAAGPLDRAVLLRRLEQYEHGGLPSDARLVADDCLWLAMSPVQRQRELGQKLAARYRDANVRLVVTQSLLNRLTPKRDAELSRVRDTVLGNRVRGHSLNETDVAFRLIPDPERLLLSLVVTGKVAALTSSISGPATFNNASRSTYMAWKPIELRCDGLKLWPAKVRRVHNVTRLRSVETEFDGVPLLGLLAKGIARSQHDQKRYEVRREIEGKVTARARQQIDREANARLAEVSERLQERVLHPLAELSIAPEMITGRTTSERMTMRLRLAAANQLGGHTPRPYAPSDSLASFQIHQSAINNLLERLELDGKTFTLGELRERVATRMARPKMLRADPRNDDVRITFAKKDAVRVDCRDGRIALTLSVAKLKSGTRRWKDFQVRVYYRPEVHGLSAELVRDGVIELIGRRVRLGSQVALRGIFSKTFSKKRSRQLIPERIVNDPKMADLAITQAVIEDGWIGIALGPKRGGARPRLARK